MLIAVAKRTGLRLDGVSFPGHFLVRAVAENGARIFIDPFEGRVLSREEIHAMWEEITGQPGSLSARRWSRRWRPPAAARSSPAC